MTFILTYSTSSNLIMCVKKHTWVSLALNKTMENKVKV